MRYGISSQVISAESKDVSAEKIDKLLKNLPNIIDEYKQKDIYNVDESGLFIISCLRKHFLLKTITAMVERILKIASWIYFVQTLMAVIRGLL